MDLSLGGSNKAPVCAHTREKVTPSELNYKAEALDVLEENLENKNKPIVLEPQELTRTHGYTGTGHLPPPALALLQSHACGRSKIFAKLHSLALMRRGNSITRVQQDKTRYVPQSSRAKV